MMYVREMYVQRSEDDLVESVFFLRGSLGHFDLCLEAFAYIAIPLAFLGTLKASENSDFTY